MSKTTEPQTGQLPSKTRWQLQWRGLAEVSCAVAWAFVTSYLNKALDPPGKHLEALWFRGLGIILCLIGITLALAGLLHLRKSRAGRNDVIGIISLFLMFAALPVLLVWTVFTGMALQLGSLLGR
jgi:hypothetical protein